MSEKKPLVSILILTMNHEKFIQQACASALAQSYPHVEIIFLDNASSDATFEIAKKSLQQEKIPFQVYKNETNFGVAKNLNFLLSKASGDYVGILSGDDWWEESLIAEKVDFIEKTNCDFVLSDGYKFLQETGKITEAYSEKDKEKVMAMLGNFFHENMTENRTVNVGTFVKREILNQYPFDENIQAEDWDMNLRLTNLGYKIGFLDKKLFHYRLLSNSLSRNWVAMEDAYKKVTDKYLDLIKSDKNLNQNYQLNLLQFKFQKLLSTTTDAIQIQQLNKDWKREKYKIKYSQPILFFKLFLLNFK
jgi:glycosyltransferase involved in cell wall biosynthesis